MLWYCYDIFGSKLLALYYSEVFLINSNWDFMIQSKMLDTSFCQNLPSITNSTWKIFWRASWYTVLLSLLTLIWLKNVLEHLSQRNEFLSFIIKTECTLLEESSQVSAKSLRKLFWGEWKQFTHKLHNIIQYNIKTNNLKHNMQFQMMRITLATPPYSSSKIVRKLIFSKTTVLSLWFLEPDGSTYSIFCHEKTSPVNIQCIAYDSMLWQIKRQEIQ